MCPLLFLAHWRVLFAKTLSIIPLLRTSLLIFRSPLVPPRLFSPQLYELFKAYSEGDIDAFNRVSAANADLFSRFEMDKEHVQRRVRLNSLALACADVAELSFAEAARKLGIQEDAVELWVIDGRPRPCESLSTAISSLFARRQRSPSSSSLSLPSPQAIRSGLIEAKINALDRSISVTRTSKAPFSLEQWKDLRDRLQEWKDNIGDVKSVLADVNVKMQAQQQEAQVRVLILGALFFFYSLFFWLPCRVSGPACSQRVHISCRTNSKRRTEEADRTPTAKRGTYGLLQQQRAGRDSSWPA